MPIQDVEHPYPLIDSDPHFSRVIRYMRPVDLGIWAGVTAFMPALVRVWEHVDTSGATKKQLRTAVRLNTSLGFIAGFLWAYQNSSKRFWGWSENAAEVEKDFTELSALAKAGKPLYGESALDAYGQSVAAGNSQWSALKFQTLPWFNFANHPFHGVDTSKYYESSQKPS
ncbi:NADH-ubiquinone oxidoreductase complex I, 21 kDa subunit-domain-containing protein [Naematelia encephala]|uniref:NADH-ubiquinone oxidoreductase complex I, 21 kDa subunit-domain-containing protein n=1 Tax=Naematelia encephala TaxID=71784 RepID=A0A1Y2BBB6_9TREE|nr:NADH-ubiquinone oxidoreductase complex I, 21 kDa subunit-domain-containing protein [Naematelia encephala]